MTEIIDFYRERNHQIKEGKVKGEYMMEQMHLKPSWKDLNGFWQKLPIAEFRDCSQALIRTTYLDDKTNEPKIISYSIVETIPLMMEYYNTGMKNNPNEFKNQIIEWLPIKKVEEILEKASIDFTPNDLA